MITPKFKDRTITVSGESNKVIIKELKNNVVISDSRRSGGDGEISVYVNGVNAGRSHDIEFDGHISFKQEDGKVKLTINEPKSAPTLAIHFAGFYETLQDLTDAIPSPSSDLQAIVISPSEKYYHAVASQWVELAPVGSIHADYVGAYDNVGDLVSNNPSAPNDSIAIVGAPSDRDWYVKESGQWEKINSQSVPKLTARMDTAEQHLQTLQSQGVAFADDIKQLQDGQFNGIHIEDDEGNSFDGISGLAFDGATVQDDQGTGLSAVVISTKLPIANGQSPDSVSETVKALEFPNAHIVVRDPDGANVGVVTIPQSGGSPDNEISVVADGTTYNNRNTLEFEYFTAKNVPGNPKRLILTPSASGGIVVGDGANASRSVNTILFNGHQAFGSGNTAEIHLEFAHFKTIAERDSWAAKFATHMDFDLVSVVDNDGNGFVGWYKFDSATKSWKEYDAQGVVMSDSDGAIPKNIKTVVYGPGFSIQQAGDQEDAALVTYTGHESAQILSVGQQWGDYHSVSKVYDIETRYPIEVATGKINPSDPDEKTAILTIKPGVYEAHHSNACLLKLDTVESIAGQKPHNIYMREEIVPTGSFFGLNSQNQGIDVQDNTGGDTALTGGQLTEALVKVEFLDSAPEDGNVKVWLEYKDPSDPIDKKILLDVNGVPLAVEKQFKANDEIGYFVLAGGFLAKATQTLKVVVETSFSSNSKITLDPLNTMICLNQFGNGYETSIARIEFLRRAALQITPAIQKFSDTMLSLVDELYGIAEGPTIITAGAGYDTLNEFGIQNLTDVSVEIKDDAITVKDVGSIADFYFDTLIDNTHTRMLRGKQVSSAITIANPDNAFEFEAYKWTGKPDAVTKVYSSRTDGSININADWTVIKGIFIAEQADGNAYGHTLTFDVPDDANNIIVLVRPQAAQSPSTMVLSGFDWGSSEFTGYVEIERYNIREEHLRFDESYAEYLYTNEGYASARYTINNTPPSGNPMPVGKLSKGKAPVERDGTVNQVQGSQLSEYDGAIKFLKDGEASISKSYNVWNETGTDNTVTFWDVLFDIDGNETKIPESEKTFTIKANTGAPGTIITIPAYAVDVETGQRIGGRATSNIPDGAFVQSQNISEYLVQTIIDFKELVTGQSDDPDLVSVALNKSLVVDRRYHEFSGNSAQNITISNFVIPDDVILSSVTAERSTSTGYSSINDIQHSYNRVTQKMTVNVGGVSSGTVFFEFWSK